MAELRELYQQTILDHNRNPRNFRVIKDADRSAHGDNPLCGDKIRVYVKLKNDVIEDVSFDGSGCAISQSSASLMTTAVMGKSVAEADQLFAKFHAMVTAGAEQAADRKELGKLAAFAGVREFPARVKCANLAWHTLHAALESRTEPVSTE
ncbi:MAG: SUF system NifU family Fe-S cluster assembly protein [Gemmatimonadota bacterium]|nr:MAG: SUF system NifU family Fe-S cluster assembly protein [Gemmatimonadota bacterium]